LLTVAGPSLLLLAACGGGATADRAKAEEAKLAAKAVERCGAACSTPHAERG
jgi:hypothetical protein